MAEATLTKGDRLTINPEVAEGFLMPLRKYAKEGRPATVIAVRADSYIVEFEWRAKKAKPVVPSTFHIRFADAVPHAEAVKVG